MITQFYLFLGGFFLGGEFFYPSSADHPLRRIMGEQVVEGLWLKLLDVSNSWHFLCTSTALQWHFNGTSMALQWQFNITLTSLQQKFNATSTALQRHKKRIFLFYLFTGDFIRIG